MSDMIESWKQKQNTFGTLFMDGFLQRHVSLNQDVFLVEALTFRTKNSHHVLPGAEFRVAYEEALKYGRKVILGDRPVQVKKRKNKWEWKLKAGVMQINEKNILFSKTKGDFTF
ncbi:hypothetical protein Bca101_026603 [Brassica carinata]